MVGEGALSELGGAGEFAIDQLAEDLADAFAAILGETHQGGCPICRQEQANFDDAVGCARGGFREAGAGQGRGRDRVHRES